MPWPSTGIEDEKQDQCLIMNGLNLEWKTNKQIHGRSTVLDWASIGTVTLYTACASTACKGSSQLYY